MEGKSLNEMTCDLIDRALMETTVTEQLTALALNVEWLISEVRQLRERLDA